MLIEANKHLVKSFLESHLVKRDNTAIQNLLHNQIEWVLPKSMSGSMTGASSTLKGHEAVMNLVASAGEWFVPGTLGYKDCVMVAENDTVVAELNVVGVIAESGKQYNNKYVLIFVCRKDRIFQIREYLDTHYTLETFS